MKKKNILWTIAIVLPCLITLFIACVKDLEEEGIYTETKIIGTVVEKSTMQPIKGVIVSVTDGTHVHASTTTNDRGAFALKDIDYEACSQDYYLWLDGSLLDLPSKQEELKGVGKDVYDYKALVLYDKTNVDLLPQVDTVLVLDTTALTAKVTSKVIADGEHEVFERGVCVSKHQVPTMKDSVFTSGGGLGDFDCIVTGLKNSTTYYVRAYAINSIDTVYGKQTKFKTKDGIPDVTTFAATDSTYNSAKLSGSITNDGGAEITQRGFCYGTSSNPDINGTHTTDGTGVGTFTHTLQNLQSSTKYYFRAYATNACTTMYGANKNFTTCSGLPKLTTSTVSDITATTAKCGGNITDNGGFAVTARGICWNKTGNPTTSDSYKSSGSGNGSFTCNMTGLTPGTTYYVKAYAKNSRGIKYGDQKTFTTPSGSVTMTLSSATNKTATSATFTVNITNDGGGTITERGICWNTSPNPTVSGSHVSSGTGTGSFSITATGLTPATTYYVRAYATNAAGTSYSSPQPVTTTDGKPQVTTAAISNITATSAKGGGEVTDNGGFAVTARGICWNTTGNPTTGDSHKSGGTGNGSFTCNMTNLTAGTTYHVRAYATNSQGTKYGSEVTFTTSSGSVAMTLSAANSITATSATCSVNITDDGGASITERGICWATTQNPTKSGSHISSGTGTGSFSATMSGLSPATTYYVRAYAVNAAGTKYSNQINFTTNNGMPQVTTGSVSSITATNAVCSGNITSNGGFTITAKGFCWSTSQYPTVSGTHSNEGSGNGSFTGSLTNLQVNTTYYVRAYATNSKGTSYGSQVSFTTENGLPTVTTTTPTLSNTTVVTGGNVTSDGGYSVTARGICYGTFPNPDLTNTYNHTTNGSGTGYYSSSFSLPVGSGTYYIRAYATNVNGTSYGEQVTIAHPYDTLPTFAYNGHTYRVAPDPGVTMTWSNANTYCNGLELYGCSDWRLPTKDELYQMYIYRNSIGGFLFGYYWSSTSGSSGYHWYCGFSDGSQYTGSSSAICRVRPIREED